jgi:CBS domain-containing protein
MGLVSHRDLLHLFAAGKIRGSGDLSVRDVMKTNLITVERETPTLEALRLMRDNDIGCLPVLANGKLVGVVTAYDFLTVSSKLFEERLSECDQPKAEASS